jgi:CDP-diglyceride synthetase
MAGASPGAGSTTDWLVIGIVFGFVAAAICAFGTLVNSGLERAAGAGIRDRDHSRRGHE